MIDKAQEYIWATARVLEQRRFEFLFGDDGDPAAIKAALEPYKTADGGYGYALEPDGRGPTSQPPHIWTALEVLEELGETDPAIADHLQTLTAPDGGVPVALPTPRAVAARAVVGHRHRGDAARDRAALLAPRRRAPVEDERRGVLLDRDRGDREDPPVRGRVRDHVPGRGAGPPARGEEAERLGTLVREQQLVGTQPEGYSPGEIHHPHNFAKSPKSLARAWFTDSEIEASLDHLESEQRDHGGWEITWAHWIARDRDRVERPGDDRRPEDPQGVRQDLTSRRPAPGSRRRRRSWRAPCRCRRGPRACRSAASA